MRAVAALAFLVFSAACQAPPPLEMTDSERQAIAEEIHQLALDWMATGPQNDLDASLAFFMDDVASQFVGEPALFLNRLVLYPTKDEVRQAFEPTIARRSGTSYSLTNEYVAVLSADHAVQVIEALYAITDTLGNTGPEYPMANTTVWVRRDGGWKILHFHQSWSTDIE